AFVHRAPGHFTAQHERLLAGIAAQASIALDNARLLRDLQDADRRKDEFLAVLGHELRNPLAPVVTALEVMKRDRSAAERQLAIIERQARHMVRIVDELLDVSRISRGKIELRKRRLSVREAIAKAADSVSPMARARGQKLTVSFPQNPLVIDADPVRLEQILGNLLSNAIKYTPDGGSVELSARQRDGQLEVRVRDSGIGIPAESLETLFHAFVQVPGAKDYAKGGLGIGLALVRGLVELHGGTVEVESAGPGQGATFNVLLPGVSEGATPLEVRPLAPAAHRGRVLVVDDNVDAAITLAEGVALDGHDVRVAHDGPSAVEQARAFSPEVVLLGHRARGDGRIRGSLATARAPPGAWRADRGPYRIRPAERPAARARGRFRRAPRQAGGAGYGDGRAPPPPRRGIGPSASCPVAETRPTARHVPHSAE